MSSLPTFKILVLGDVECGKTSIVSRYVYNRFDRLGTNTKIDQLMIKVKHIYIQGKKTRIQFWDIAGQEIFVGLAPTYYTLTCGIFIVIDITRKASINQIIEWKNDFDSKIVFGESIPWVLLVNKWDIIEDDIKQREITDKELNEICLKYGFCGWFSISAKTSLNVNKSVDFLLHKIIKIKHRVQNQDNIKKINPYCLYLCCHNNNQNEIDYGLLQNQIGIQKQDFSETKSQLFDLNDDDDDNENINTDIMNTFGIKDFEQEINRIFLFSECIKMFIIIMLLPLISIFQLFDFIIYSGYFTKKWVPSNFDESNIKNQIKWDFIGTIIGLNNNNDNNLNKDRNSRLFIKQSINQLLQRFIVCFIINFFFVVQFILLYHYYDNDNNNKWLTSFECVGPSILWLIIIITMGIWYGYKCNLPYLNDEMLFYQNLTFKYKKQIETVSVLNFFLSLNQFNTNKIYNKDKFRNLLINIILFLFGLEYCFIPSILRFICNVDIVPIGGYYFFLWINSIILHLIYSFIFLKISCNTSIINGFRLLLFWYNSLIYFLNINKSIKFDLPFLSFKYYDNIISWVELRGYLHYLSFSTFNNMEIWILLYMLSMIFLIIISIINGINLNFKNKDNINCNCICIGAIYFCLLCIIHSFLVYLLGQSFNSLHNKQLKECNRQRLILNREILKEQSEEKENESIDMNQISINLSKMKKSHNHLNDVIDFLKQHRFTPNLLGVIRLNRLIWISLVIIMLTTTFTVLYVLFKNDSF